MELFVNIRHRNIRAEVSGDFSVQHLLFVKHKLDVKITVYIRYALTSTAMSCHSVLLFIQFVFWITTDVVHVLFRDNCQAKYVLFKQSGEGSNVNLIK